MKIIVGLGNPGAQYRNTRHNVGFRALDCLAERLHADFDQEKYGALIARVRQERETLLLMKPLTYMNNSGAAVARAARNRIQDLADLLVVVDDVHLAVGKLRMRGGGSSGGHNGLQSIIEHLGTQEFPRLRMGVGECNASGGLVEHVLGTFKPEEKPLVEEMVVRAADAVVRYVTVARAKERDIEAVMNEFN